MGEKSASQSGLDILPQDILHRIFECLDRGDLCALCQCSKRTYVVAVAVLYYAIELRVTRPTLCSTLMNNKSLATKVHRVALLSTPTQLDQIVDGLHIRDFDPAGTVQSAPWRVFLAPLIKGHKLPHMQDLYSPQWWFGYSLSFPAIQTLTISLDGVDHVQSIMLPLLAELTIHYLSDYTQERIADNFAAILADVSGLQRVRTLRFKVVSSQNATIKIPLLRVWNTFLSRYVQCTSTRLWLRELHIPTARSGMLDIWLLRDALEFGTLQELSVERVGVAEVEFGNRLRTIVPRLHVQVGPL